MATWTKASIVGSFLALLLLLAACGQPGISAEDAESLRSDVETIEGRLDDLNQQIAAIEEEEEDDPAAVAGESRVTLEEIQEELESLREALEPPEPEPAPEGGAGGAGGVGGDDPLAPANP